MLKNIPKILSPELLKVLCEMGHSDRIVIADANFPAESMGKNAIVIRADGHNATDLLDAILTVFPLDTYVDSPVMLMQVMAGDNVETPIWDEYKEIVAKHDDRGADGCVTTMVLILLNLSVHVQDFVEFSVMQAMPKALLRSFRGLRLLQGGFYHE